MLILICHLQQFQRLSVLGPIQFNGNSILFSSHFFKF